MAGQRDATQAMFVEPMNADGTPLEIQIGGGSTAHGTANTEHPIIIGGQAETTAPTAVDDGDVVRAWFDEYGRLVTTLKHTNGTALTDANGVKLTAGTQNVGRVGVTVTEITATKTAAAAGDYAAGDVISESATNGVGTAWSWAAAARETAGTGTITRATLTCSEDAVAAQYRLWLFNDNPSASELDDNAVFELALADRGKVIDYIDFLVPIDGGTAVSVATARPNIPFKTVATTLYGILQFLGAEANETASMTVHITLQIVQD